HLQPRRRARARAAGDRRRRAGLRSRLLPRPARRRRGRVRGRRDRGDAAGGAAAAHGVPGTDRPRAAARREPGGGARALRPALGIGVRGARAGHPGRRPYRARPPDLVSVRARMSPPPLRVRALLRTATDAEITVPLRCARAGRLPPPAAETPEPLDRTRGPPRLRPAGYEPAWFELDVEVE